MSDECKHDRGWVSTWEWDNEGQKISDDYQAATARLVWRCRSCKAEKP